MKYFLPGMGAGPDMYAGPWREIADACFVDWPPYDGEKSIGDLARRLVDVFSIQPEDMVIGTSLGGMVGLEIARCAGVKRVFLVSSAVSPMEFRGLSRKLLSVANRSVVRVSQSIAALSNHLLPRMYVASDPDFVLAMSKAILDWKGFRDESVTIRRIHGRKDHVIRCPADGTIIDDGDHLIAMTHARECVDAIKPYLSR